MTVKDAIERRRSSRTFKKGRVAEELVMELVEAARLAPSAHNRQNWKFMVLHGKEKDRVADTMTSIFSDGTDLSAYPSFVKTSKESATIIKSASHAILCLKEMDKTWEYEDLIAMGAAIENMLLRGEELGLATLWIRDCVYTEKRIKAELGIGEYELVSIVAVGEKICQLDAAPRKPLSEIVLK